MKKTKFFLSVLKERDWLEEMAAKGYILKNITMGMCYDFEETEPCEKVYEIERFAVGMSGEADKEELTAKEMHWILQDRWDGSPLHMMSP